MENNKEKIQSPFRAPEGYFDIFEQRLNEKINEGQAPQMKVTSKRGAVMDYIAVAATVAAIMVTGWFVLFRSQPVDQTVIVQNETPKKRDTIQAQPAATPDPAAAAEYVVADIIEDATVAENTPATAAAIPVTDKAIAVELEDAGLIVMDVDDGLFDTFEL